MGWQHGKDTYITVGGDNITAYTNTSELSRGAGTSNVTCYGKGSEVHEGTLKNGKFTCGGVYDNTAATGPHAVFNPLIGTTVEVIRRPEGAGTGRPEQTFDGVLVSYVETSPVADMVTWSAEFTVSDDVAETTQA
ncbi:MAG TPA: hypothetical protein VGD43_21145 [Micromonospora sp.]